jgi:hypothetical protein
MAQGKGFGFTFTFLLLPFDLAKQMNEDWLAVIVGLGLVALVAVRLVAQVPW